LWTQDPGFTKAPASLRWEVLMIPRRVLLLAMACTLLTGSDAQADSILEIQFDTPRGTLHIGPATPRGPFAYLTIPDDEISTLYCSPPVRIGCGPSFD